ncbi:MAG TPA: formimidoylglutamase [Bdellovibrionales bacterium]|nr:formimidoylglutamase [Bdellovibrionales bacterium]
MSRDWAPTESSLFFKKNDPDDPRLGELVSTELRGDPSLVLAGYPDDEGIKNSGGRTGAKDAPKTIRKYFYKMTPSAFAETQPRVVDVGDLTITGELEARHERVRQRVRETLKSGHRWAGLGGGHDYGFADGAGFLDVFGEEKPIVINFDAHLDVRPVRGAISSGTPFNRLFAAHKSFDFAEIGIQSQCNSRKHLEWVEQKGARVVAYDRWLASGRSLTEDVLATLDDWLLRPRPAYLSVDIDGFSSAHAPGCSQSFATGFDPNGFFELFDFLCARLDVRILGLYEVSPPLDQDDRTSKLAALILHRFLQNTAR